MMLLFDLDNHYDNKFTFFRQDVFQIKWQLLGSEITRWGETVRIDPHTIYMEERLLAMVWKILQIPMNNFHFHFTGADPIYHPAFLTLMRYLATVPRNIYVTVDANGQRELSTYVTLARTFPRGFFRLNLTIYQTISDYKYLLVVIGILHDNGQTTNIRVANVNTSKDGILLNTLCKLRKVVPFSAEFANENWNASFNSAAIYCKKHLSIEFPPLLSQAQNPCMIPGDSLPQYCVSGFCFLRILPDGSFFTAPCDNVPRHLPLWGYTFERFWNVLGEAIPCSCTCQQRQLAGRTLIDNSVQAHQSTKERSTQLKSASWKLTPITNPLAPTPKLAEVVKSRIASLIHRKGESQTVWTESYFGRSISPVPGLISDLFEEIVDIWPAITEEHRNFLILLMLTLEYGDPQYLESPPYGDVDRTGEEILQLNIGEGKAVALHHDIMTALNSGFPVEISGSLRPESIIHFFISLIKNFKVSSFTINYIESSVPNSVTISIRVFPALSLIDDDIIEQKKATVIIVAKDGNEQLEVSVDSIVLQGRAQVGIIIVDQGLTRDESALAIKCQTKYPKLVRHFHASKNESRNGAINLAFNLVHTRYVAIMDGDSLACNGFPIEILEKMDKENADIGLFKIQVESENGISDDVYWGGATFVPEGIIYSRQFLATRNLHVFPGGVAGLGAFQMAAFHCAGKIVRIDKIGCRVISDHVPSGQDWNNLLVATQGLNRLSNGFTTRIKTARIASWLKKYYQRERLNLYKSLSKAAKKREIDKIIDDIMHEKNIGIFLRELLQDYTSLYPFIQPAIDIYNDAAHPRYLSELDDRNIGKMPIPRFPHKVTMSVILIYQGVGKLTDTLNALLNQTLRDLEIIIITSKENPDNKLIAEYETTDFRIHSYICEGAPTLGAIGNFSLSRAHSDFIAFIKEGEIPYPEFLQRGVSFCSEKELDLVLLPYEIVDEKGTLLKYVEYSAGEFTHYSKFRAIIEDPDFLSVSAKIFRTKSLYASKAKFNGNVAGLEEEFILNVIRSSMIAGSLSFGQALISLPKIEREREIDYSTIRRSIAWFTLIQDIANEINISKEDWIALCETGKRKLEKDLLGPLYAISLIRGGKLPLAPRVLAEMSNNGLFIASMFTGYSQYGDEDMRRKLWPPMRTPNEKVLNEGDLTLSAVWIGKTDTQGFADTIGEIARENQIGIEFLYSGSLHTANIGSGKGILIKKVPTIQREQSFAEIFNALYKASTGKYFLILEDGRNFSDMAILQGCALLEAFPDIDAIKFNKEKLDLAGDSNRGIATFIPPQELLEDFLDDHLSVSHLNCLVLRKKFLEDISIDREPDTTLLCLKILGNIKRCATLPLKQFHDTSVSKRTYSVSTSIAYTVGTILEIERWLSTPFSHIHAGYENTILEKVSSELLSRVQLDNGKNTEMEKNYYDVLAKLQQRPSLMSVLLKDAAHLDSILHGSLSRDFEDHIVPGFFKIHYISTIMAPSLSVILAATDDVAKFSKSMESLLKNQGNDIEFIIIDQQLNGEIFSVAKEFAAKCKRIQLYSADSPAFLQESLDFGIHVANGKYIAFLESGDMLEPHVLEHCLRTASKNPDYPIIQFSSSYWDMARNKFIRRLKFRDGMSLNRDDILEWLCMDDNEATKIRGKLFRKDCLIFREHYIALADSANIGFLLASYMNAGKIMLSSLPAWRFSEENRLIKPANILFTKEKDNFNDIVDTLRGAGIAIESNLGKKLINKLVRKLNFRSLFQMIANRDQIPHIDKGDEVFLISADIHIMKAFIEQYIRLTKEYGAAQ